VDDQFDARFLLRRWLDHEGYQIYEAEDGETALALFDEIQPDIVLLDALMPGIDGFEVSARLYSRGRGNRPLVLMITALSDEQSVDKAFEAGAADYVTKPIHWPVLRQRLRRLVIAAETERALRAEVAERQRAEAALEQERNLLRILID